MNLIFSKNIVVLRRRNKLSQEKLGAFLNIKRGTISSWEEFRSEPKLTVVKKIAAYFGVSLEEILCVDISQVPSNDPFYFQL